MIQRLRRIFQLSANNRSSSITAPRQWSRRSMTGRGMGGEWARGMDSHRAAMVGRRRAIGEAERTGTRASKEGVPIWKQRRNTVGHGRDRERTTVKEIPGAGSTRRGHAQVELHGTTLESRQRRARRAMAQLDSFSLRLMNMRRPALSLFDAVIFWHLVRAYFNGSWFYRPRWRLVEAPAEIAHGTTRRWRSGGRITANTTMSVRMWDLFGERG